MNFCHLFIVRLVMVCYRVYHINFNEVNEFASWVEHLKSRWWGPRNSQSVMFFLGWTDWRWLNFQRFTWIFLCKLPNIRPLQWGTQWFMGIWWRLGLRLFNIPMGDCAKIWFLNYFYHGISHGLDPGDVELGECFRILRKTPLDYFVMSDNLWLSLS